LNRNKAMIMKTLPESLESFANRVAHRPYQKIGNQAIRLLSAGGTGCADQQCSRPLGHVLALISRPGKFSGRENLTGWDLGAKNGKWPDLFLSQQRDGQ